MKTDTQIMNEVAIKTGYLKELPNEQSKAQNKLLLEMYKDISKLCDEHGLIKGRFRVKQTEEGRYYAVRIMKHTDEKGALKIYEKQIKEREHRRRRRQAEKLTEQK